MARTSGGLWAAVFNRFNRRPYTEFLTLPPLSPAPIRRALPWWTAPRFEHIARPRAVKGAQSQAVGRSRGGRTTGIHAIADDQGRIAAVLLTPGQTSDISGARALLPAMPPPEELIADKAYGADDLRASLPAKAEGP